MTVTVTVSVPGMGAGGAGRRRESGKAGANRGLMYRGPHVHPYVMKFPRLLPPGWVAPPRSRQHRRRSVHATQPEAAPGAGAGDARGPEGGARRGSGLPKWQDMTKNVTP